MTRTRASNVTSSGPTGHFLAQGTAFLPLLILPLTLLLAKTPSGRDGVCCAALAIFVVFAVPGLQILGASLMLTYSREAVSVSQRWLWLVNAMVCWAIICADPGGWQFLLMGGKNWL